MLSSILKKTKRFKELVANDYAKAKELAAWKERVAELWDSIEIVSCEKTEELASGNIESGKEYIITYVIDEKGLDDAVGIELVTTFTNAEGKEHIYSVEPMEVIRKKVTCIHSRLNTVCLTQAASRWHTVCSRRMLICLIVRTSAMFVGLTNH